jgi:hypothetical protein
MADIKKYSEPFMVYRAKNSGDGSASQWSLGSKRDCVFLEMANQKGENDSGNANFDWENKLCFKLGTSDIGEILTVLSGLRKGVGPLTTKDGKPTHKGLFHSNDKGNAILCFAENESQNIWVRLSVKKEGGETRKIMHSMSQGEACILHTLLRRAIEVMYWWC